MSTATKRTLWASATLLLLWMVAYPPRVITQQAVMLFGSESGVARAVAVNASGAIQATVSGVLSSLTSWTTSAANTATVAGVAAGPATAPNTAVNINNSTAATVGVPAEWSPGLTFSAPGWDTDDLVSRTTHAYFTLRPVSGTTVTNRLVLFTETSPFSGTYNDSFTFANSGNFTALGAITAGASNAISLLGRSAIQSTANGLLEFNQNSGALRVQMNTGTAIPTVANCSVGSAGSITATSTNTAGEVNPGSGSTSCDVVFGAPAFTNAPFCTVTDETTAAALRISARATTGFTVVGLTAGDKFTYVCFGGVAS